MKLDRGPILNEDSQLRERLDSLLRVHAYKDAAQVARQMVSIAEQVFSQLKTLSNTGMTTSTGFIKSAGGPGFHAGYDYLTGKGYDVGVCSASEAVQLCEKAARQGWDGEWLERVEGIEEHEKLMIDVRAILAKHPDILQSDMLRQCENIGSMTLYYAAERGDIVRIKKGRSYTLRLA